MATASFEKLGFNAVMFVDVGRVEDGNPEYLSWEAEAVQSSGRWQLQLHSGHGHQQIQYGPGPNDYGAYYAFERQDEKFAGWRRRVRSDINWGPARLHATFPPTNHSPSRLRTATTGRPVPTTRTSPKTCSTG